MAILNDDISAWEIGFRWAGRDPARLWPSIPLDVRDNFRMILEALLASQLESLTISMHKRPGQDAMPPEFYVRYHLDDIEAGIEGRKFSRKLLRFIRIERWAFKQWCERRGIPLPEFWFPPGWGLEYRYPEDDGDPSAGTAPDGGKLEDADHKGLRPAQRAKIACQQIASAIWKAEPGLTIKEMAERDEVSNLGGGAYYDLEVVKRWLSEVDPREPSKKRGRRKAR